jgi:hypothetical protein
LLAHELTHTIQQKGTIRRTMNEGFGAMNKYLSGLSNSFNQEDFFGNKDTSVDKYIKYGSRGMQVKMLQETLMYLGYDLPQYGADGIFGNETRNAVVNFQRDNFISPDGIVGPITMETINKVVAEILQDTGLTNDCKGQLDDAESLASSASRHYMKTEFGKTPKIHDITVTSRNAGEATVTFETGETVRVCCWGFAPNPYDPIASSHDAQVFVQILPPQTGRNCRYFMDCDNTGGITYTKDNCT